MTSNPLPFLTIVIPTYDEQERLLNAVNSLSQQEYPKNLAEIIVVDEKTELLKNMGHKKLLIELHEKINSIRISPIHDHLRV